MLLEKMMKRPLLLAIIATFGAVGCSSAPPARQVSIEQPGNQVVPLGAGGSPQCGVTNFDRNGNRFTIVNLTSGTASQQCFLTVVSKQAWPGGQPDFSRSQLVEGNYQISLSGGGGGAGGSAREGRGYDGGDASPVTRTAYLSPGVYRLTIGTGGLAGQACLTDDRGGRGRDGGPTSLSEANSGKVIVGYPRAESWDGRYESYRVASATRVRDDAGGNMTPTARSGQPGGGGRAAGGSACDVGAQGSNGFIRLALADPVQPARAKPAPVRPAPAATETVTTPPPAAVRPARRDRN
jgi:hypothetical protein